MAASNLPRPCVDCDTDISALHFNASRCLECRRLRKNRQNAAWMRRYARDRYTNDSAWRENKLRVNSKSLQRRLKEDPTLRDRINERTRARRAADPNWPEYHREYQRKRYIPNRKTVMRQLREEQGGLCGICGEAMGHEDIEIDHIVPISRGGGNETANLQVAHGACNRWKDRKLIPPAVAKPR